MKFGEALEAVKSGAKIYREGWNGKGQFVKWIPGFGPAFVIDDCEVAGCLALKNAQGVVQPGWVPSQGDLFADDWLAEPVA
ncbi:DUF2829 domain-containing protein [Klebsiella pasteurii]|uniref:DUF2829 domain-containing protein n=1 Tax=Klebsiella pasteurii TaxID=2587529 RepID=UPI00287E1CF8|nr:DUF2829 domain-containing protein [Klebsiella pasteurii]MDS7909060.1 DUF2829 domain-containing protein [Klebsiella pasteurii]MDV0995891.1 DUF2829 domain-containing protein [Klebsiella pasteurii]